MSSLLALRKLKTVVRHDQTVPDQSSARPVGKIPAGAMSLGAAVRGLYEQAYIRSR
jgi:hypothetical protein